MKKKVSIIIIVWGTEIAFFLRWLRCWQFIDTFYFTQHTLANALLIAIHTDKGVPLLVTRALHNKIFALFWGLMQTVLQYWDIRFLEEFLGIAGAIGVFLGLWYILSKYNKHYLLWGLVALSIVCSLLEAFFIPHIPFIYRILPLAIIFQLLSLFGIWEFIRGGQYKIRFGIIIVFLLLSLLALWLMPSSYQSFCLKI